MEYIVQNIQKVTNDFVYYIDIDILYKWKYYVNTLNKIIL